MKESVIYRRGFPDIPVIAGGKMDNDQDITSDFEELIEMRSARDKSITERDNTDLRRLGKKQMLKVRMTLVDSFGLGALIEKI